MLPVQIGTQQFLETIADLGQRAEKSCLLFASQGLAAESIQAGELLWKIRPKYHKLLGCLFCLV